MYLCLDLALRNTGWALFSEKGKLLSLKNLTRPRMLRDKSEEVKGMTQQIQIITQAKTKSKDISTVVIEDIYHNKNFKSEKWMARLSGAVIKAFDAIDIKFYPASQARRLAGIKGTAHKAEIQIYVLDSLKKAKTTKYQKQIEKLNKEFDNTLLSKQIRKTKNKIEKKKLKKERTKLNGRRKYRLNKLSKLIEKETGYSEHICDAIILGKAYHKDKLET